jgi:hypothetical protein
VLILRDLGARRCRGLKGFAVDEEAAVVVEMEGVGISVCGQSRSGWTGMRRVASSTLVRAGGLRGGRNRRSELGPGSGMG